MATNDYLRLNATNAATSDTDQWGAGMTSTVIGLRASYSTVASTDTVAYCFAAIPGYSAFGSYTGSGSADGPFVYTGFRPAYVLTKNTGSGGWVILDNKRDAYNVSGNILQAGSSAAELPVASYPTMDIVSNGFKIRSSTIQNTSSATYIYVAFAENPFKYSLAR